MLARNSLFARFAFSATSFAFCNSRPGTLKGNGALLQRFVGFTLGGSRILKLPVLFLELYFGVLAQRDIPHRANHMHGLPRAVAEDAPLVSQPSYRPVGPYNAVLNFKTHSFLDRAPHRAADHFPVFRMHESVKRLARTFEFVRFETEQRRHQVRPDQFSGQQIRIPTPHVGGFHRQLEPGFALPQGLFRALPFGIQIGERPGVPPDQDIQCDDHPQREQRHTRREPQYHFAVRPEPTQRQRNQEGGRQQPARHRTACRRTDNGGGWFEVGPGKKHANAQQAEGKRCDGAHLEVPRHFSGGECQIKMPDSITARYDRGGRQTRLCGPGVSSESEMPEKQGQADQGEVARFVAQHMPRASTETDKYRTRADEFQDCEDDDNRTD